MENNKELVLVHRNMKKRTLADDEKINLMLTPQFYTMKREEVPVKYAYQAKKIASSLFEGLIEDIESHKYFVVKEKEAWLFVAYDENKIKIFLESKNIDTQNIAKLYFCEQSVEQFNAPVLIGETEALVNLSGKVTIVPQVVLSPEERVIQVTNAFTPKNGVNLEGRGASFISTNEAYTFAVIFTLFAVLYFIEGSRYGGNKEAQKEEIKLLLEDNPSLQSTYKRESIANKYRVIDIKERKKRDVMKSLSKMIFKGSTLTRLMIDETKFKAAFSCSSATIATKVKELAKKAKLNTTKDAKSQMIIVEGKL